MEAIMPASSWHFLVVAILLFSPVLLSEMVPINDGISVPMNEPPRNLTSTKSNLEAFFGAVTVILVSEIGDKTFFIAAIMAMRHSRILVFVGAISALAFMTVLSVGFGTIATFIPKMYTHVISIVLFVIFGVKMLREAYKMAPTAGQEEYEQVQADLKKREEERAKMRTSNNAATNAQPTDPATNDIPMVVIHNADGAAPQLERDATRDAESGGAAARRDSATMRMMYYIILQAFTLTFVAEWGDRSQLITIVLASRENAVAVALGGIVGHTICTSVAVIGGRFIAMLISVKTVTYIGGATFLFFAGWSLYRGPSAD